jgi:hypothetical protein
MEEMRALWEEKHGDTGMKQCATMVCADTPTHMGRRSSGWK